MRPPRSWLWLALLAGLPILVLTSYAVLGLRAERRATLADAHAEGRRLAVSVGNAVELAMDEAIAAQLVVVRYAKTPEPSSPHPDEERFREARAGGDIEDLEALCDSEGQTSAGLPICVLAAWELYCADGGEANLDRLGRLALHEAPSVVSPLFLEKAGVPEWRERWKATEKRRRLIQYGDEGTLMTERKLLGWAEDGRVLTREEIEEIVGKAMPIGVPEWMRLEVLSSPVDDDALLLASHRSERLETQAWLVDKDLLLNPYHRRQRWTMAMIALAALTSGTGVALTQRALRRERHLSDMKSQFVASVSHELRAPVASMRLMAEALESGKVSDSKKARSFHRLMADESARLASMVENVLDFARIEQDRKAYTFAETDVEGLAEDAVALLRPQADSKDVLLLTTFEKFNFTPVIDSLAVQQALINLLDNAIKFSSRESVVTVTLRALPSGWFLRVADEGPGIPAEHHGRILERFTRLENELRRETQGAGIGLSLVQHVMHAHQGEVVVDSAPGKGSTFTLRFPRPKSHV